jgi:hypothetical protein
MAHPYHHVLSSVKKWGGEISDYLPLHAWFDQSKAIPGIFVIERCGITPRAYSCWLYGQASLPRWRWSSGWSIGGGVPADPPGRAPGPVPYLPLSGVLESTAATHA